MSKRPTSRSPTPFLPGANNGHCPGRPVDAYDRRFNGSDTLQTHLDDQREAAAQMDFHQAMGHRLDRNGYLRERWLASDDPLSEPETTESETDEDEGETTESETDEDEDEAETTESETDSETESDCSWNSEEEETDQEPETDEEQPSPRPGEACQTCRGCREGLANQQAHMDFGGCLAD